MEGVNIDSAFFSYLPLEMLPRAKPNPGTLTYVILPDAHKIHELNLTFILQLWKLKQREVK